MRLVDKCAVLVFLAFFFMLGLWMIDISASAMITHNGLVGLLGAVSPEFNYHLGLLLVVLAFFLVAFWVLHMEAQKEKEKEEKRHD